MFVSSATHTRNTPVYSCRSEGNGKRAVNMNIKYSKKKKQKKKSLSCAALIFTGDLLLLPSHLSHAESSNPANMWDQAMARCERCPKE